MLESVRCPGCTAHYGLRPERVHDAIRRARCFRCGDIFNIEAAVARLLAPAPEAAEPPSPASPAEATPFEAVDLTSSELETPGGLPAPQPVDQPSAEALPALEEGSFDGIDLPDIGLPPRSDHPTLEALNPIAEGDIPGPDSTLEAVTLDPLDMGAFEVEPSLEPLAPEAEGDLEALPTLDTELPLDLDALLEVPEVGEAPDHAAPQESAAPEALPSEVPPGAQTLSLRDLEDADEEILNKTLVVEAPPSEAAAPGTETASGFSSAKDAISRILGGLDAPAGTPSPLSNRSQRPVDMDAAMSALDDTLGHVQASAPTSPAQPQAATGATVRLNAADLQAAMSGMSAPASTPLAPPPTPRPFVAPQAPAQDLALLKIQVGTDVYDNLNVERLTEWIMEGRVLEHFMVARQNSENWIEAVKVPSLRPAFDRLRRMRGEPSDTVPQPPPPPEMSAPAKKGLFGFLRS